MPRSTTHKPKLNLDIRGRGYVFTVVALAVFAVGLVALRPRTKFHVVESLVNYYPGTRLSPQGFPIVPSEKESLRISAELQARLRDSVSLEPALVEVEREYGQVPDPRSSVPFRLFVHMDHQDGQPSTLRIRYLSRHTDFAKTLVDSITDQFVNDRLLVSLDDPSPSAEQNDSLAFATATLDEWTQRCHELQLAIQEMEQSQLAEMRQAQAASASESPAELADELTPVDQSFIDSLSDEANEPSVPADDTVAENPSAANADTDERMLNPADYPTTNAPPPALNTDTVAVDLNAWEAAGTTTQQLPATPADGQQTAAAADSNAITPDTATAVAKDAETADRDPLATEFADQPQPNPHWLDLHNELALAQHRAHEMLELYTPEHPLVIQTMMEVEAIRQRLHKTPRVLHAKPAPTDRVRPQPEHTSSVSHNADPVATLSPVVPFDEPKARQLIFASEAYQRLQSQLNNAVEKRETAQHHLDNLPRLVTSDAPRGVLDPEVECARLLRSSAIVGVERIPMTLQRLLLLLVPACLIAGVVAASRRTTPAPAFLCSPDDAAKSLRMPVVGSVSQPRGPSFEMPDNPTPTYVTVAIRMSEAVLVAVVMLTVIGLVTLPEFAMKFTASPFDAYSIGLDHIESFFRFTS